jgi:hypothetical protein
MRGLALLLGLALAGCGAPIERPYTQEELEVKCVMRGGWWHRDDLMGGFCEFQAPGFL